MKNKKSKKRSTMWKNVLIECYRCAPAFLSVSRTMGNPELMKKLKLSLEELHQNLIYLKDQGLVEDIKKRYKIINFEVNEETKDQFIFNDKGKPININKNTFRYPLRLTEKGFNVAFEIEKQIANFNYKFATLIFSGMLVVSTVFSFFLQKPPTIWIIMIVVFVIILAYIYLKGTNKK